MGRKYQIRILMSMTAALSFLVMSCGPGDSQLASSSTRFTGDGSVRFVEDGVSVASTDVSSFATGLSISLALSIAPPSTTSTGGQQLYASDLKVVGNKVITAFNVPGNVQKGWIDYIDVSLLAIPLLEGSQYFPDSDINSVAMAGGNFAVVGAKTNVGSVLRTGTYGLFGLTTSPTETLLTSYAGTGITFDGTGTKLALTSGDTGGVSVYNSSTLAHIATSTLADSRGITYHAGTNRFYAVKGQTGEVHSFDINGTHLASVAIGGATIAQSKATIVAGTNFLLATTGDGGFSVICAQDLKVGASQAQYVYPNYAAAGLPGPTLTVRTRRPLAPA